jgi:glycogen debranching enzyme
VLSRWEAVVAGDLVRILDGSSFVVSDRRGDMLAAPDRPHGLFHLDTRFLSRWRLTVDGQSPEVLSTDEVDYFSAQFFLVPPTGTIYRNPTLSVIRQRFVGEGMHEDVIVLNHGHEPVQLEIRIDADADFADLFEVKDALAKKGECYRESGDGELLLGYRRDGFVRETRIRPSAAATSDADGLSFRIRVDPTGQWRTCLDVILVAGEVYRPKHGHGSFRHGKPNMGHSLDGWLADAPRVDTDSDTIVHTYRRSLVDLAALRFYPDAGEQASLPAAGLPWFMAVFGRDSIITSYQALPFTPELASATLAFLAARQASAFDGFRDAEPGKIMHELRYGELTVFGERPHSPYYGTADATPLYLVLLDEYERWTGDRELVARLEPNARAALDWIDRYGDRDGDGYVEYERRNTDTGLENQCWKDSGNSILFADGTVAPLPRATCEIQGYVYDAKVRCARLAREVWGDPDLANRLEREAGELKRRFDADFWMPARRAFAVALDGHKRQVDSLTSNIGHLLWSGIVDDAKAGDVVGHLMGERLFSGWGVRTMADGEGGYNPIEYHNGTVWPHDNSLIAAGLARYGYREEAARIARAQFDAAAHFGYRLPETFAGYPRSLTHFPVEYPTASSPQAWATGTPLLLLRVLLGLEPAEGQLTVDPVLPEGVGRLGLHGVPGRWGRVDT